MSSNNWFTNSRSSSYYSKEEKSVHTMVITGTQSSPCEFLSAFIVWPLMVSTEAGHLGHTHCSCWIKLRWRMNERDLLICFWLSPILLFAVYGSIWSATLQDLVGVCSKQPALCRAITVFYFHIYSVFQFWHQHWYTQHSEKRPTIAHFVLTVSTSTDWISDPIAGCTG